MSKPIGSSVVSSSRDTATEVGLRPEMVVMLEATLSRLSLLASRRGAWNIGELYCSKRLSEVVSWVGEAEPRGTSL